MRLTVNTFLTLDGVMQGPGGPEEDRNNGFAQGGWQVPYMGEDMGPVVTGWFEAADAFLLGRKTYEIFAGHWPRVTDPDDPVAGKLNSLPKYVASTTLDDVEWNNSTLIKGDLADGRRLFPDGVTPTALELVDTKVLRAGGVIHVYQPAGKPQFGSVLLEDDGAVVRDSLSKRAGL